MLALVIGIDVYRTDGLEDLSSSKKDAEGWYEVLSELGYTIFQDEPVIASRLNKEYGWVAIREAIVKSPIMNIVLLN